MTDHTPDDETPDAHDETRADGCEACTHTASRVPRTDGGTGGDTLELARETKRAYGHHLVAGGDSRTLKRLIDRYDGGDDGALSDRLESFVRTRGPYLQALDLPRRSDTPWETFADEARGSFAATEDGLHDDVIRTFTEAGFTELFDFQERTVSALLDDDHTLVTAGTGRGKTESWLVPSLQFVCEAKAGDHPAHPPQSTKCLLTYPTKALAQDQLKRLIEYLYEVNRTRSGDDLITVGIFDGDTPPGGPDAYEYLSTAFQFFDCPCEYCNSSLTVERTDDDGYVVTHDAPMAPEVTLDYVHLTREEIVTEQSDIVLTNPDTVNYRLFNVNETDEQAVFVEQPKYVVFDEIHEYDELFGSYTAILMRRYLRTRERLRDHPEDLTVIGASATVENRREVFQRIMPFTDADPTIVAERPREIDATLPEKLPSSATTAVPDEEELIEDVRRDEPTTALGVAVRKRLRHLTPDRLTDASDSDDIRRLLSETLYDDLLAPADGPGQELVAFLRGMYTELYGSPREPEMLVSSVASKFGVDEATADRAVDVFVTLGRLSGVLESRAHLFSWPIDGYYTCLRCAAVYDTPQSACQDCGHHFVTKLAYCNHCGEEAVESWFCPDCERLAPVNVTSREGQFRYFNDYQCPCGTEVTAVKALWRPVYECNGCGERQHRQTVETCPDCGDVAMVLRDDGETLTCTNPACETTRPATSDPECSACEAGSLEPLADDEVVYCTSCGQRHESGDGATCQREDCRGELTPKRYLGWACGDTECDAVYFGDPPSTCSCGKRRFVRTGLLDVTEVEYCETCDTDRLPGAGCDCDDPDLSTTVRGFEKYKLVDEQGRIRDATDFPGAVPCYHSRTSYRKDRRYESLLRGPGNTAVTTGQYLLRSVADMDDPESLRETKLLSFADSQRDMKQLRRDFQEPEEELFVTQLVVAELDGEGWRTLAELQSAVTARARSVEATLLERETATDELLSEFTQFRQSVESYLEDEVSARVLHGKFGERWRSRVNAVDDGLLDVRLSQNAEPSTADERAVLRAFESQATRSLGTVTDEVDVDGASRIVEELIEDGPLCRVDSDDGYVVELDPTAVEVTIVDEATPTRFDPATETFESTFERQLDDGLDTETVSFTASPFDRAAFDHPHTDLTAFRVAFSEPTLLLAEAYYGQTEAAERRSIEYQFREGRQPHFLSSGPAMEVGMDIGDLDALLLYGTPPNANSYLQRVGRAGRESGSSLVHSVSQRNPIDYYYYERPTELVSADPQPVPLNEANGEVLRVSLTWALLDFLAATRWVPWRRERSGVVDRVVCEDAVVSRSDPRPSEILRLSQLLQASNDAVQGVGDDAPLEVLREVVDANRDEARDWLRDIVGFSRCDRCGRKHADEYRGDCRRGDCDGTAVPVTDDHENVVEAAFEAFETQLVERYIDFEDDLLDELDQIDEELRSLRLSGDGRRRRRRRDGDDDDGDDEATAAERQDRLRARSSHLQGYLDQLEQMDYQSFLERHSTTPFSLRSVSDTVTYDLVGEGFESVRNLQTRDRQIALSELHPGSVYIEPGEGSFVVTEVVPDRVATADAKDDIRDDQICLDCGEVNELDAAACEACGGRLRRLTTIVPQRVTAHKADMTLGTLPNGEKLKPARIHDGDAAGLQSTYAPVDSDVTRFEPTASFDIVDDDGETVGQFDFGDVTILSTTETFRATYAGGGRDPLPNAMEMCGVEDCHGVVARDDDGAYCVRRPEHDTTDTHAVRLAASFDTKGVRVRFDDEAVEHTVAHGIRVGLQYVGGVDVRQIPESIQETGTFVYDAEAGGAGITTLLTRGDGDEYPKFNRAVELMGDNFECDCESGCPFCLYQYQCTTRNDPSSFDVATVRELLADGLTISPVSTRDPVVGGEADNPTDASEGRD
ncbi:DEAD/DEAH box helicase [Halobaculum sp. MBLA0147]|uniref:DEAD/DEAH box helicase n=1 Tax=Halobaculum sp. MBLA0147 TaxID=3079934 RepID=UPI0035236E2C